MNVTTKFGKTAQKILATMRQLTSAPTELLRVGKELVQGSGCVQVASVGQGHKDTLGFHELLDEKLSLPRLWHYSICFQFKMEPCIQ